MHPNKSLSNTTSGTARPVGTEPTVPQTEAALSPKLLDILQYHESTRERTPSNATILSDDRRTTSGLSEGPASTPVYQTSGQHMTGGIMQRFGPVDKVRQGPSPSPPSGSTSASITGSESWHPTETTLRDQTNPDRGSKPVDGTRGSPESRLPVPEIMVQADSSVASNNSAFTIVDDSEHHHPTTADSGTNRGIGDARNSRGPSNSRSNRVGGDTRRPGGTRKLGSQQLGHHGEQPGGLPRLVRAYRHDPPVLPSRKLTRT